MLNHSDAPDNKKADQLSILGVLLTSVGSESLVGVAKSIITRFNGALARKLIHCKHLTICLDYDVIKSKQLLKLGSSNLGTVTGLLTGHCLDDDLNF